MIRRNVSAASPKFTADDTLFNQGVILEIGIDALFYGAHHTLEWPALQPIRLDIPSLGFHAALFVTAIAALA